MSIRTQLVTLALAVAIGSPPAVAATAIRAPGAAAPAHEVVGVIRSMMGSMLVLQLRNGRYLRVDASSAVQAHESVVLSVERPIEVVGGYDAAGVLHAQSILRAKSSPFLWKPDR